MNTEQLITRLASRGLLPCEHNLMVWQCVDDGQWGAAIETPYFSYNTEAYGGSLHESLENLMRTLNRGADLPPAA